MSKKALSKFTVFLMAVAAGASVANIYYNQPILKSIAESLNATESQAGIISMLTQAGYGLGLFFIIPLGDKFNKKKLILTLLGLLIITLCFMASASTIIQVWVLSALIGVLSVSVQVIVPLAAGLDPVNRGKTVGAVFSGILTGILAARVFAGFIAEWLGWRYVFGISGGMLLIIGALLQFYLPGITNEFKGRYLELLKSTLLQVKRFSLLRRVSLMNALTFGVFCSFWTTFTFHMSGAPFYFHTDIIGLFGLAAITGALGAPIFGRLTDKGKGDISLIIAISLIIVSIIIMKLYACSVPALVIGVFLLDLGTQIIQVTNMASIYSLDENSHSRINTVFMTSVFIGGAAGTFAGLFSWRLGGWQMATWQMLLWALGGLAVLYFKHKNKT